MQFLDNSRHLWRVWKASTRASIVREMEFRTNFWAGIIRQILWLLVFVFFIEVIFQNTNQLAGWQRFEVLIVLALSRIIEGTINLLFAQNIMELPETVREGRFDFYLIRPVPVQFTAAFRRPDLDSLGNLFAGIVLLIYAVSAGPIIFSFSGGFLMLLLGAIGILIYYCLLILTASLVFFLERLEMLWGFNMLFSEPLTIPFDVFPRGARIALTYLLPLAFVVFVPSQALTGRLVWWQVPVAIGIAALFLTLANAAWRAGLRRYSSASS